MTLIILLCFCVGSASQFFSIIERHSILKYFQTDKSRIYLIVWCLVWANAPCWRSYTLWLECRVVSLSLIPRIYYFYLYWQRHGNKKKKKYDKQTTSTKGNNIENHKLSNMNTTKTYEWSRVLLPHVNKMVEFYLSISCSKKYNKVLTNFFKNHPTNT